MIPRFRDSQIFEFINSCISTFLNSRIPRFLDFQISTFLNFYIPRFPDSQISGFPDYQIAKSIKLQISSQPSVCSSVLYCSQDTQGNQNIVMISETQSEFVDQIIGTSDYSFHNPDDFSEVLTICLKGCSKQQSESVDNTLIISDYFIQILTIC